MSRIALQSRLLVTLAIGAVSLPLGGTASAEHSASVVLPVRRTAVPVLMYHVVAKPPASAPYPELYVRPEDFAAQVQWLDDSDFTAVTLRALWEHWFHGAPLPRKPVVVTFDDGYRSVVSAALPALAARSWPAVLNLTFKNVGLPGGLTQRQVRRLRTAGWELAAHSLTHPDLTGLGRAALAREVAGSRSVLRRTFGVPVDFFCYPSGRYDASVVAAVEDAGYLGATTTISGLARPEAMYELRRVRVSGSDGVRGLAATLASFERP
jgi:peptidoglycan/xylan/chitin deacetylase (PgdA/CDA1 family)